MRASLLIAAHNEGESLWKTIRSCVESTTGLEHEIIVADDASTDESIEAARRRFPHVRFVAAPRRGGAAPTKHLAAVEAAGEVLIFLDGHTHPETGALRRLVEDVEALEGDAIVTPAVPHLDPVRWLNSRSQVGHGYTFRLDTLECGWVPLAGMSPCDVGKRRLYESPALIGCVLAIGRGLYQELWGFDAAMRSWGVEDIDFGLKARLLGYPILHDPQAIVGHRFRQAFDNYAVPPADLLANQLRFARKHFTSAVWFEWAEALRLRNLGPLPGHPEGLWARAWSVFEEGRESIEQERQYLMSRRTRDEFDYAETFALDWPRLQSRERASRSASPELASALSEPLQLQPSPSPSPPPECDFSISPLHAVVCTGFTKTFTATGDDKQHVQWSAAEGDQETGTGETFSAKWTEPFLGRQVEAKCGSETKVATVDVLSISIDQSPIITGFIDDPDDLDNDNRKVKPLYRGCTITVEPPEAVKGLNVKLLEVEGEPERLEIINIYWRSDELGKLHFSVGGKMLTLINREETIQVLYNGVPVEGGCGEIKAKVVVPWEIGEHPQDSGVVTPENLFLDATTSPANFDPLPANYVALATVYAQWLVIPVVDQFGNRLDSIYAGAQVEEMRGSDWHPINQEMRPDGTYRDPVFKAEPKDPGPTIVERGSPAFNSWRDDEKESLTAGFDPQTIPVRIGGHKLKDGIKNRTVTAVPPSTINIAWP